MRKRTKRRAPLRWNVPIPDWESRILPPSTFSERLLAAWPQVLIEDIEAERDKERQQRAGWWCDWVPQRNRKR